MVQTPENYWLSVPCKICKLEDDTTSHVLSYLFLKLEILQVEEWSESTVDDVYMEDVTKMNLLVQAFEKAWRKREEIIFNMSRVADPTPSN